MEEVTRGRLPGAALRVVMVLGLLFGAPIASVVKSVRVNLALAQGAEPATLARLGIGDAVRLGVGNEKGVLMHRQARDDLARIRETIAAGDRNFVNLSELSFLYQDFDQPPPEGLPLWFDHGISFQDAHIGLLTDGVVARGPEVILLQDAHDHGDRELHGKLSTYYREHGYRIAFEVRAPRRAERPITVFVRR
jgi:hypothetical protein